MGLAIMIAGLAVFIGAHAFTTFRDQRAALIARLGEGPYKVIYSLISLIAGRRTWREVAADMPDAKAMLCIPYGLAIFAGICIAGAGIYLTNIGI